MQIIIYQYFLSEVKFGGSLAKIVIWDNGTPTIAFQKIENWVKLIFFFQEKTIVITTYFQLFLGY